MPTLVTKPAIIIVKLPELTILQYLHAYVVKQHTLQLHSTAHSLNSLQLNTFYYNIFIDDSSQPPYTCTHTQFNKLKNCTQCNHALMQKC